MQYTDKVLEHFKNPHNQGTIADADAVGQEGNQVCGDVMKMYLKIKPTPSSEDRGGPSPLDSARDRQEGNYTIEDIKFETLGCAAAIAVSSMLTDLAKGKTLEEGLKITKDDIVKELGGLPDPKIHCSMLGVDALHAAINNYLKTRM